MFGLEEKVILISGGSRGIGLAAVNLLKSFGAKVASISREHEAEPADLSLHVDVRDAAAVEEAINRVEGELGPIYGAIANAGINRDGFFAKIDPSAWREVLETNLFGSYNLLRPLIPRLQERRSGSVVLVSSIVGERGNIGQTNYSASKAALIGMAKSLARETARFNVRINVVAPGFANTEMTKGIPEKVLEKLFAEIPLGRFAEPQEIAWAYCFLLSPTASSFVTGEVLRVNGGHHT